MEVEVDEATTSESAKEVRSLRCHPQTAQIQANRLSKTTMTSIKAATVTNDDSKRLLPERALREACSTLARIPCVCHMRLR